MYSEDPLNESGEIGMTTKNKGNTAALQDYQEKVASGEVERSKSLNPTEKALKNPTSLRFAINAKCFDCVCGQKLEIKHCEMTDCSLWPVRPYQDKAEASE